MYFVLEEAKRLNRNGQPLDFQGRKKNREIIENKSCRLNKNLLLFSFMAMTTSIPIRLRKPTLARAKQIGKSTDNKVATVLRTSIECGIEKAAKILELPHK